MARDSFSGLSWIPFLQEARTRLRAASANTRSSERAVRTASQTISVEAGDEVFQIAVRRHRRARRYTLRIHATRREAVLSMPTRGNLADAKDFAQRHADWLASKLGRLPDGMPFVNGADIPLRGESHRIVHRARSRGTVWTECGADGANLLCVAGETAHTARRVKDFLKREARRDLALVSRRYADMLGVRIARMTVRDQTSRWGSCNSDGVLSYSWRLILAPPFVLDYLAAHEVAHLVEMNHSPRFWRVVAQICPEMERAKAWLHAHGNELHRYGVE